MADAGAVLDTVVDMDMSIVHVWQGVQIRWLVELWSYRLSPAPSRSSFFSSFSFFPSLSSPLPVVSAGVMPEEGPETLVLGTSGAGQDSKVSIETTESPSGGNVETEKRVPEVESGLALSCREGM